MSSDKLSRYGALFDEAANYLLIGNNNVVFEAGYNATESQAANNRYLTALNTSDNERTYTSATLRVYYLQGK